MEDDYSYSDDSEFLNGSEYTEVVTRIIEAEKDSLVTATEAHVPKVSNFFQVEVKSINAQENADSKSKEQDTEKMKGTTDNVASISVHQNKYSPVTHVIFDLDGTLLDTESIKYHIIADIAAEYNKEFTPEIRSRMMGRFASEAATTALQLMDIPITSNEFDTRVEMQNLRLMSEVSLMPGAERLIKHLYRNEVPMAVATSSTTKNYEIKSTKHKQLFKRFHHIVTGGSDPEVITGKPAPDIYLICASRFPDNPRPCKCLAIEDSPNGVTAAVNAGMQVVMIADLSTTDPEYCTEATIVLKSMTDFQPEMFGLPRFDQGG